MFESKKSQVLIFSTIFLVLLLLVTYSLETENSYKLYFDKNSVLENIIYETCQVGRFTNGSNLDPRFEQLELDLDQYCLGLGINCNLTITKLLSAPINISDLNYSHYEYYIDYNYMGFNHSSGFVC